MPEKIPNYFLEFTKDFKGFKTEIKDRLEKIQEKQESHFEAIGEVKIQLTNIELKLDNKANKFYADGIDNRVEKLEKVVFA